MAPPLQYSCLENPMDGEAWWAAVHGVAKSRTRLIDFTFSFHFNAFGALALYQACAKPFPHTILFKLPSSYWRRQWQATPVLLPRKSHGQRSCSPWGREESDVTE